MLKDIIKNILINKNHSLIYNQEYYKNFNYYLILKIFSTNLKLIPFCTYFNKLLYKTSLSKYDIHQLFLKVFPKMHTNDLLFLNIKNNNKNDIMYVQQMFDCGENDARYYISIYNDEWLKNIINLYKTNEGR